MPTDSYKKFSEVAVSDLATYLRLTAFSTAEETLLQSILAAAKNFVLTYTGRSVIEADTFPEFTIAVYAISEDMFDKRTYIVDSDKTNEIVNSILGSRSVNLL